MTIQKIWNDLSNNIISTKEAYEEIKNKIKTINYYAHINDIRKEPISDGQLQELDAIVNILQTLYNSDIGSPVDDSVYDSLQEILIDMGIPRLTGSIITHESKKIDHKFRNLRGTLDKIYYLSKDEPRTNKSRRYLDEWMSSAEAIYFKSTGKKINLNDCKVLLQPKFDGVSAILEWDGKQATWLNRGDTSNNKASDISHIMSIFNDLFCNSDPVGMKFEVMVTEENKDRINSLYRNKSYKNSRQVVISTLNSLEADFKSDYLYPVPLRIAYPNDSIEQIHPMLLEKFPTDICLLSDRDKIRDYAFSVRYVNINGMRFRTDGIVITILDPKIQSVLGRENDINRFEVAYKFTEETAFTKVKDVEFYVSEFGYITPVLVVNDVIMKGNTVNHISLHNKERFDEMALCYGDTVKVLYDIIPYATIDESMPRQRNGRRIEFIQFCPRCREELDLNAVEVQCKNPSCPSRVVGRILNYCNSLRIKNIGYSTMDMLYSAGLLNHGIRSLYKLKKKANIIADLEGFGKLRTRKLISEIEAKRRLKDYEFYGALGIEGLSTKTFQMIFNNIKLSDFNTMLELKNFDLLFAKLLMINGIGESKAMLLIDYLKDSKNRNDLVKLLEEVSISESFSTTESKGKIVFTGCRPNDDLEEYIKSLGYESSDSWNNSAKCLVVPDLSYSSSKVGKAKDKNIPIIGISELREYLK